MILPRRVQNKGILDEVQGCKAAYSTKRLVGVYNDPCVQLRKRVGGITDYHKDFYFKGEELDWAGIEAWLVDADGGYGFVAIWYNQLDVTKNAYQDVAINQGIIDLTEKDIFLHNFESSFKISANVLYGVHNRTLFFKALGIESPTSDAHRIISFLGDSNDYQDKNGFTISSKGNYNTFQPEAIRRYPTNIDPDRLNFFANIDYLSSNKPFFSYKMNAGLAEFWTNGGRYISDTYTDTQNINHTQLGLGTIGWSSSTVHGLKGYLNHVLMFDFAIPDTDRQKIENFFIE